MLGLLAQELAGASRSGFRVGVQGLDSFWLGFSVRVQGLDFRVRVEGLVQDLGLGRLGVGV